MSAPSEVSAPSARHDLPALDGLRGFAALLVVVTHTSFLTGGYSLGWLGTVTARFDVGVALFFVLSGFLLTRSWTRAQGQRVDLRRYARHRAARILPAYWVALLAVVLTVARSAEPSAIVSNAVLAQTYTDDLLPAFTQTWSLVAEVAFYVVLPLLAPWLARGIGSRAAYVRAALLGAVGLLFTALVALGVVDHSWASTWMPAHLLWFATGMALAVVEVDATTRAARIAREWATAPGTLVALAVAAFWLACTALAGPVGLGHVGALEAVTKEVLYAVVGTSLVLACGFARAGSTPVRSLGGPVARWGGRLSYAVFLWHQLVLVGVMSVLGVAEFGGRTLTVTVATVLGSVVVAALSYVLVERPVLRAVTSRDRAPQAPHERDREGAEREQLHDRRAR
ncbi:MAG: acyltransferase [Candidatus Nanopelagicales bacterium]